MSWEVSGNTQAILLLTAPLSAGRNSSAVRLLTPGEYKALARALHDQKCEPADLVGPRADEILSNCGSAVEVSRVTRLLERGVLLSQAVELWRARSIWVVSRADQAYPKRLKSCMREDAPSLLYGCGKIGLLETGGLAIVGSRNIDDSLVRYATEVGGMAARAGLGVVSGDARGVDRAAMDGALDQGGVVVGVLADGLMRAATKRENRRALMDERLVLVSSSDPGAGFNVGVTMQRNKLIYAMADAGLVVQSDVKKGGTWAGAIEQISKLHYVPVYVRTGGAQSAGLVALRKLGALPWPNPTDENALREVIESPRPAIRASEEPAGLPFGAPTPPTPLGPRAMAAPEHEAVSAAVGESDSKGLPVVPGNGVSDLDSPGICPSEELFETVRRVLLHRLRSPMSEGEIASELGVVAAQAKAWLRRLESEGTIERLKKPVRFVARTQGFLPIEGLRKIES